VLIDWFTVIAQILNFLVLVFLLQRFLYKPILQGMQTRQKRIEARWQEAQEKQAEVQRQAESYRRMLEALKEQQEEQVLEMKANVEAQRQQLVQQVRIEVEEIQEAWRESLWQEQDRFLQSLREQIAQQTCQVARRALEDLGNATLEEQMLAVFMTRLEQLDQGEWQAIAQSLAESPQAILIRSRFELSHQKRQLLRDFFQEIFGEERPLRFITSPAPICGIEVKLGGYEIAWSLDDYLQTLEERLGKTIKQEVERGDGPRQQATASRSGKYVDSLQGSLSRL
jgi:F-type H+-transporting ATPase subunit b